MCFLPHAHVGERDPGETMSAQERSQEARAWLCREQRSAFHRSREGTLSKGERQDASPRAGAGGTPGLTASFLFH